MVEWRRAGHATIFVDAAACDQSYDVTETWLVICVCEISGTRTLSGLYAHNGAQAKPYLAYLPA